MGDANSSDGFSRIPYARQSIDESDIEAVVETLRSDFVTQGPRIAYFEDGLKDLTGAQYAIAVSSGTAALHLACRGLDLGRGDIGISPAITFVATANAIAYCGADVSFADVDPNCGLSRAEDFANAVEALGNRSAHAKAFIPVSYSGRMPDLDSISEYAQSLGASVIEDAAHSLGATNGEARSGSCRYTEAATLSFHPVKHICSGEGGAMLTNDPVLARRARSLRSHGIERPDELRASEGAWAYAQTELGCNYRMTDIQASLGASQLKRLDKFIERRRAIALRYSESLATPEMSRLFEVPDWDDGSSWHLYVIRFQSPRLRRQAYEFLQENGVGVQVHYMPVYRHPYYRSASETKLPGTERFYEGCLSLPMYPGLEDDEQMRVVELLARFSASNAP